MMKRYIAIVATFALVACTTDADRCAKTANPQECLAWTDAGGDLDDYLVGGMLGYTLATMGNNRVIVRDPYYHGPARQLRRPLLSQSEQIRRYDSRIRKQREEIARNERRLKEQRAEASRKKSSSSSLFSKRSSSRSSFSSRSSRRR